MEETDSLLELLVKRGGESDGDEVDGLVQERSSREQTPQPVVEGRKCPKDDRTVIEELHTLNHQLRDLVAQLVTQLDARTQEVERLRSRIRILEASSCADERRSSEGGVSGTRLHVITDSIGGTSPFVFSPCSELSPDVVDTHVTRELPVLAPLEMPNFDFSIFSKTSDSSL